MSSDVMIVCKELKNSYDCLTKENNYTADIPAVFIDEASMGDPWHEFGKWFVNKYYNGHSMLEVMMLSKNQEDSDKLGSEIFNNPFTQFDYKVVCEAMDEMECHDNMNKEKVKEYLHICMGKSISTENW